jgi:hypothetical protein
MKTMRRWLLALPLVIGVGALAVTACVGDEPVAPSATSGSDAAGGVDGGPQDSDAARDDAAGIGDAGPSCAYAASVSEDHPLYYYRFAVANPPNEGSGDGGIVTGEAGTVEPPGAVGCEPADKGVRIDGTGGSELFGLLDAPFNAAFSIELLFEPEPGSDRNARLFTRESFPGAPSTALLYGYNLVYDEPATGPKTIYFTRYADSKDAGMSRDAVTVTPLEDKAGFRHVAATFDGTDLKVYVDGSVRGTVSSGVQPNATPAARAFIGARVPPSGSFDGRFKGRIDEVAYYNHALTPERVATHYAGLR